MTDRIGGRVIGLALLCLFLTACSGEKSGPAANNTANPPDTANPSGQATATAPGQNSPPSDAGTANEKSSAATATNSAPSTAESAKVEEPFNPPATLAELEKDIEWEDQPVRNAMQLFQQHWAE